MVRLSLSFDVVVKPTFGRQTTCSSQRPESLADTKTQLPARLFRVLSSITRLGPHVEGCPVDQASQRGLEEDQDDETV
jgi:hypothetical protein